MEYDRSFFKWKSGKIYCSSWFLMTIVVFTSNFVKLLPRGKGYISRLISRLLNDDALGFTVLSSGGLYPIAKINFDDAIFIINNNGKADYHVVSLLHNLVKFGESVVDVGANSGYISSELFSRYKDQLYIHSFEPIP